MSEAFRVAHDRTLRPRASSRSRSTSSSGRVEEEQVPPMPSGYRTEGRVQATQRLVGQAAQMLRERRAAAGHGRQPGLLVRRARSAAGVRREDPGARLPQRHGPRLRAARTTRCSSAAPAATPWPKPTSSSVIGTPMDFRLAYGRRIQRRVQGHPDRLDPTEIGRNRGIDIGIEGDAKHRPEPAHGRAGDGTRREPRQLGEAACARSRTRCWTCASSG